MPPVLLRALGDLLLVAVAFCTALVLFEWVDSWGVSGLIGPVAYAGAVGCAAVAVPARRRWPAVALVTAAAAVALEPLTGGALAAVAYTAGYRCSGLRRRAALLALVVVAPLAVTAAITAGEPTPVRAYEAMIVIVTGIVCGALPGLVGALAGQRERLVLALRERNAVLERAQRSAEEQARSRERARIAGEMHDLLGHRLSLVALHSGGLELAGRAADPEIHRTAVLVHSTVREAMGELRGVLGVLSAADPAAGAPEPLTAVTGTHADVAALVAESRAAGIAVDLRWGGDDLADAAPTARRAVHRVVRESLTNVHRHAAGAVVEVTVHRDRGQVRVDVRNGPDPLGPLVRRPRPGQPTSGSGQPTSGSGQPTPGRGQSTPGSGLGLAGLHERVRVLGGSLRAAPTGEGGFLVDACIPLRVGPAVPRAATMSPTDVAAPAAAHTWLSRTATAAVMGLGVVGAVALQFVTLAFVPFPADTAPADVDRPGVEQPGPDRPGTEPFGSGQSGSDRPGVDEPGDDMPGMDAPGVDVPGFAGPSVPIPFPAP
ncbi:histidine kinase [Kitasatospora sp. NPDC048365]|uniref:histidine kinase n=1 Tax=Kitasatospora sp. NPDC048365 TaxID=3364050 RepID=UPI003717A430